LATFPNPFFESSNKAKFSLCARAKFGTGGTSPNRRINDLSWLEMEKGGWFFG